MAAVARSRRDRELFAGSRVARLATSRADGAPHLVPVVFVLLPHHPPDDDGRGEPLDGVDDVLWSVVDGKPKSTTALRRLANITADPRVSLLVDRYADDWSSLWWVRADGRAQIIPLDDVQAPEALAALRAKYPQYAAQPPPGPLVRVVVHGWASWSAR